MIRTTQLITSAICVTNGVGGGKTQAGVKIPKGTPCTGWYKGKQHTDVCEGTAYGGKGWCGVEAPPGQSGKYSAKDAAWGGCVKECPKGGVAQCTCPNGTPLKGPECNEHGTPGCKSCKKLFKMNADNTACEREFTVRRLCRLLKNDVRMHSPT